MNLGQAISPRTPLLPSPKQGKRQPLRGLFPPNGQEAFRAKPGTEGAEHAVPLPLPTPTSGWTPRRPEIPTVTEEGSGGSHTQDSHSKNLRPATVVFSACNSAIRVTTGSTERTKDPGTGPDLRRRCPVAADHRGCECF